MRIDAKGGTDAAMMVLFWPELLPEEFDAQFKAVDDPYEAVQPLEEAEKLIAFPGGSDGSFSLAIFIDEDLPEELEPHCIEIQQIKALTVRGIGYFGGFEYMCKNGEPQFEHAMMMGEKVTVPAGTYGVTIYKTELPAELKERQDRFLKREGTAGCVGCLIMVVALMAYLIFGVGPLESTTVGAYGLLVLGFIVLVVLKIMSRDPELAAVKELLAKIPSFVITMKRKAPVV